MFPSGGDNLIPQISELIARDLARDQHQPGVAGNIMEVDQVAVAALGTSATPWGSNPEFASLNTRYFKLELMSQLEPTPILGEFKVKGDGMVQSNALGGVDIHGGTLYGFEITNQGLRTVRQTPIRIQARQRMQAIVNSYKVQTFSIIARGNLNSKLYLWDVAGGYAPVYILKHRMVEKKCSVSAVALEDYYVLRVEAQSNVKLEGRTLRVALGNVDSGLKVARTVREEKAATVQPKQNFTKVDKPQK